MWFVELSTPWLDSKSCGLWSYLLIDYITSYMVRGVTYSLIVYIYILSNVICEVTLAQQMVKGLSTFDNINFLALSSWYFNLSLFNVQQEGIITTYIYEHHVNITTTFWATAHHLWYPTLLYFSPTLYVGESKYGLYALPSMVDVNRTAIAVSILVLNCVLWGEFWCSLQQTYQWSLQQT